MEEQVINKIKFLTELFENLHSPDNEIRKEVEERLLSYINRLDKSTLIKFLEYYNAPKYKDLLSKFNKGILEKKDKGAVSILRYNLLKYLLNNNKLTPKIIEEEKQKIIDVVHKQHKNYNPFHAWKSDGILYYFCYFSEKEIIRKFLVDFSDKIRKNLGILGKTNKNVVDFDGSQNQGYDHCWIAIYDNIFRSQKETKQIYIGFTKDKIIFDIYEYKTKLWGKKLSKPRGELSYNDLNLDKITSFFSDKKEEIFELRLLEEQLKETVRKLEKNKEYKKEKRIEIINKVYKENSEFNSKIETTKRMLYHNLFYNSISNYMKNNFDIYNIEENNVDMTAKKNGEIYYFEMKPYENSRYTLRLAFGQLIEYFFIKNKEAKYLCFIGLAPLGENKPLFDFLKEIVVNQSFKLKYYYFDLQKKALIEES